MYKYLFLLLLMTRPLLADVLDDYFSMSLEQLLNVEVTTTSRYAENIKDTPANIYVITQQQIKERGYRGLADLLKALPGVDIQNFSRVASPNVITFRGHADNNKFLLLQDGVRISSAGGEVINYSQNIPLYHARQVEVLMGPASVSYGADAFMGVINIITLDADNQDTLQAQFIAGTDNYGYGYAHAHQGYDNGLQLSIGAQAYQSQKYEFAKDFPEFYPPGDTSPTGNPFEFPQNSAKSFFLKLQTTEHWDFSLNYAISSTATYFSSLPNASAFDPNSEDILQTINAHLRYQTDINDELHSTSLVTLMHYETDNDTNFNNLFTNFQTLFKYASSDRISINQDFVYTVKDTHIISFGAVYNQIDSIPIGADLPAPYDESRGVNEQGFNYPGTTLSLLILQNNHTNYGVYIQDNFKINNQWRLISGLRYDDDNFYGSHTTPRFSTIYQADDNNIFKLLYGHAFLAPSPDLAFRNFGGFSGFNSGTGLWESSFFRAPNVNLKSETSRSLELNYEHWFNPETSLKMSPYYTRVDDAIQVSGDTTPQQFIPGADLGFTESYKNKGQVNIYGIDIGLENISHFSANRLRSWIYYSYTDGEYEENNIKTSLPLVSKHKLKGGLSFIYHEKYTLSPQFYWIGKASNAEVDANNPTQRNFAPSYFLMDVHGEAEISKNFSVVSDIYNLFDSKYTNAMLQGTNLSLLEAPQPGRLITLGLRYTF